jgi:hypothetical protein
VDPKSRFVETRGIMQAKMHASKSSALSSYWAAWKAGDLGISQFALLSETKSESLEDGVGGRWIFLHRGLADT